jgi:hypothetical protein
VLILFKHTELTNHEDSEKNLTSNPANVLILTPIKDAASYLDNYFEGLRSLTYPSGALSIGILESDSLDGSFEIFRKACDIYRPSFRDVRLFKKDFGFQIPNNLPRWDAKIQLQRRSILARSRNHLLFNALEDEDWILWLDVDVIQYPPDIIETLLSYGKDILQPHCVKTFGGPTFDLNAWQNHGQIHMHDLRGGDELVPLDTVGGTMLFVRADCHRDGLIFPPFLYGKRNPKIRKRSDIFLPTEEGEVETEGFGILASDMNLQCWGIPNLEIIHADK